MGWCSPPASSTRMRRRRSERPRAGWLGGGGMVQEGGRDLCCIVKQVFIFLDHRKTRLEHWGGARSPQEFCGFRFNCPLSHQYHRLLSAPRPHLVVLRIPSHMSERGVLACHHRHQGRQASPAPLEANSSFGCGLRAKIECLDPVHSKNDQTVWHLGSKTALSTLVFFLGF